MKSIPSDQSSLRFNTNCPTIDAFHSLVTEFSQLPQGSRSQRRMAYEPICDPSFEPLAIQRLWNSTRGNNGGSQEDAEEFLSYVLNKLNDEMLEVSILERTLISSAKLFYISLMIFWFILVLQLIDIHNKGSTTDSADFGRTPISDIFRGELRSRLQKEGAITPTDVMQPFFTLQLNIEVISFH